MTPKSLKPHFQFNCAFYRVYSEHWFFLGKKKLDPSLCAIACSRFPTSTSGGRRSLPIAHFDEGPLRTPADPRELETSPSVYGCDALLACDGEAMQSTASQIQWSEAMLDNIPANLNTDIRYNVIILLIPNRGSISYVGHWKWLVCLGESMRRQQTHAL